MELPFVHLLCCPHDFASPLEPADDALVCPRCSTRYPVGDGIVSFLDVQELSAQDHRERADRDRESSWYDPMFVGYTNAVEVATSVRRIGRPTGPILDAGCGTGRITEQLTGLGQPVVAVDYSEACLRLMRERTAGASVLAVQSDLRMLPLRSAVMAAVISIEVFAQIRGADNRHRILEELSRVMAPGAPLSISAYNYNLLFRAWRVFGHERAREGEHMLGGHYYYRRFSKQEFRRELEAVFDVEELVGIRNIPARSLAQGVRRVGLRRAGDRFLDFMTERGHKADFVLERTPLSALMGFFWLARARRRA
jgi:SAM-dependent methyltransferase